MVGNESLLVQELTRSVGIKKDQCTSDKIQHAKYDMRVGSVGFYI